MKVNFISLQNFLGILTSANLQKLRVPTVAEATQAEQRNYC